MKQEQKLTAQEQLQAAEVQSRQTTTREFSSAEELLRHDARQTPVPPEIAQRLGKSIENLPKPASSWWRRLLGR